MDCECHPNLPLLYLRLTFARDIALDTATALRSIPAHPEAFSVVLTDFLGEVRTIPIELCADAQVSYNMSYHEELTDVQLQLIDIQRVCSSLFQKQSRSLVRDTERL